MHVVDIVVGDRVLLRDYQEKGGTGKLKSYWDDTVYMVTAKHSEIPVYTIKCEEVDITVDGNGEDDGMGEMEKETVTGYQMKKQKINVRVSWNSPGGLNGYKIRRIGSSEFKIILKILYKKVEINQYHA